MSWSGSKKGHCQWILYDLVLRELKPRCSRAMHVSQKASLKMFFSLFVGVNLLYNYEFFLRAAFVQGLFPVGGDIPFLFLSYSCEFFGRQRLIKEIWHRIKKHEVIHHRQKIMFLQINCFKTCLMQICTLKIKIVSPGLVLLARHSLVLNFKSSPISTPTKSSLSFVLQTR